VALVLLVSGAYAFKEQLANPIQAGSWGLLFAAVLIAAAITLLYCLLDPGKRIHLRVLPHSAPLAARQKSGRMGAERARHLREPAQRRRYIDSTLIRL
jgi:hypothetical protein